VRALGSKQESLRGEGGEKDRPALLDSREKKKNNQTLIYSGGGEAQSSSGGRLWLVHTPGVTRRRRRGKKKARSCEAIGVKHSARDGRMQTRKEATEEGERVTAGAQEREGGKKMVRPRSATRNEP